MKLKQILFHSLLSFVLSTSLYAQSVSGTINDNEGMPLARRYSRQLEHLRMELSSDFDGQFQYRSVLR